MYKDIVFGGGMGQGQRWVMSSDLCYDNSSVNSWNADVAKIPSMIMCYHENEKKKEKHLILVLYNKRMIYWYLSSISEEIFVLCVNYRLFPFCYALLSVYFSMMYDDCCLVTSGLTSQTQFRVTNRWLLVEISTPKHVQKSVYRVAWWWPSGQTVKEACCFLGLWWHADFDLKNYNVEWIPICE